MLYSKKNLKIIQTAKIHKIYIFYSDLIVSCLSTPRLGRQFLNTAFFSTLSDDDMQATFLS